MKKEILPKSAIIIWRIRLTLVTCVFVFVFGAFAVFDRRIAAFLLLLTAVVYVYTFLFYCVDRYCNEFYYIDSNILKVKKGVYFKISRNLILDKIQYMKIIVSPSQKMFGLCTVYFFTAGDSISISQIEYKKALNIQKKLNLEGKDEV